MTTQSDNRRPTRFISHLAIGLALLSILGIAAGCSAAGASGAPLADRDFLSTRVTDGGAPRPLVDGTRIRLHFGATDLAISAGCNSIGGTYRIDGGQLVFDGGAMTEMGCDDARHAQDDWLVTFLASRPAARLTGNDLVLESGSVVVTLLDREVAEPDANIAGPTWTVESIINGDAVSSIPNGAKATLVFKADGSLEVFAGCNQGGSTWKAVAGGIEIGDIMLTKKGCAGAEAALESAVLAVIESDTIAAAIDGSVLTLQAGASGLQLRAS